jgi:hypothetical protein
MPLVSSDLASPGTASVTNADQPNTNPDTLDTATTTPTPVATDTTQAPRITTSNALTDQPITHSTTPTTDVPVAAPQAPEGVGGDPQVQSITGPWVSTVFGAEGSNV